MWQRVQMHANWQRWPRALAAVGIAVTITWMALVAGMVSQHLHAQTVDVLTGPHGAVLAHLAPEEPVADESLVERLCDAMRDCPCSSSWTDFADLQILSAPPSGIADWPPPKPLHSVIHDVPYPPPEMTLASMGEGYAATDSPRSDG